MVCPRFSDFSTKRFRFSGSEISIKIFSGVLNRVTMRRRMPGRCSGPNSASMMLGMAGSGDPWLHLENPGGSLAEMPGDAE